MTESEGLSITLLPSGREDSSKTKCHICHPELPVSFLPSWHLHFLHIWASTHGAPPAHWKVRPRLVSAVTEGPPCGPAFLIPACSGIVVLHWLNAGLMSKAEESLLGVLGVPQKVPSWDEITGALHDLWGKKLKLFARMEFRGKKALQWLQYVIHCLLSLDYRYCLQATDKKVGV